VNTNLILLVDDDRAICAEMSIFLSKKGYDVIVANNGRDAVELFKKRKPIVVLTDYKMPVMSGIDLLKKVKSINSDIHVILMSGVADLKTTVLAMKADAFDFLEKPVNLEELHTAITTAIDRTINTLSRKVKKKSTFFITHEEIDAKIPISVLFFNADLDEYANEKFIAEYNDLLIDGKLNTVVIFILKFVKYINNIGLNLLIHLKESLLEINHKFFMCNLQKSVMNYLNTLGYINYFNVEIGLESIIEKINY
jgi:DNA-binding response OmpR family regulator